MLDHCEQILTKMSIAVGRESDGLRSADDLIGYFQSFRPDGRGLAGIFEPLTIADQLHQRLDALFEAAGDDRLAQKGRDAYFVVRRPAPIDPDEVRTAGRQWIDRLIDWADELEQHETARTLRGIETVRVLEGIAPKNPRNDDEKSNVLRVLQNEVAHWTDRFGGDDPLVERLRSAFYYIACDAMLRDHMMWPFFADRFNVQEPFESYFVLWRHGIKFRAYSNNQLDLYMPRMD